jgi:hypothetical protein
MDKELIRIFFALLRFEIKGAELCEADGQGKGFSTKT